MIRPTEVIPRPQPLARKLRVHPLAMVVLALLLSAAFLLFFQVGGFLGHMETRQADAGADARLRAIDQQMNVLRSRFNGLLAESVENRLRVLQKNIDGGKVSADDLRAFSELQQDLALLETYAGSGAPAPVATALEHSRYQALSAVAPQRIVRNDELLGEVQALKSLFYACLLIAAALTTVLVVLYWLQRRRPPAALESLVSLRPGIEPPQDREA